MKRLPPTPSWPMRSRPNGPPTASGSALARTGSAATPASPVGDGRRTARVHRPKLDTVSCSRRPDIVGEFPNRVRKLPTTPFLGNLATADALGQGSESATTRQIFRKIEYAAGMPQDILSAAMASRAIGPEGAAMGFSSTCPAPRIFHRWAGVWRNGQTYPRHAESRTSWKNEGTCHRKMATKRDSTG